MKMREIIEKEVCGVKSQLMGLNSSKVRVIITQLH